jgi:hypothetical protein
MAAPKYGTGEIEDVVLHCTLHLRLQVDVGAMSRTIEARGETPFLRVFSDNAPAILLHLRMGSAIRRLWVTVLGNHS